MGASPHFGRPRRHRASVAVKCFSPRRSRHYTFPSPLSITPHSISVCIHRNVVAGHLLRSRPKAPPHHLRRPPVNSSQMEQPLAFPNPSPPPAPTPPSHSAAAKEHPPRRSWRASPARHRPPPPPQPAWLASEDIMDRQPQQGPGQDQDYQDNYQYIERDDYQNIAQEPDRGYQNIEQVSKHKRRLQGQL